jgi:hypothetical protein
MKTELGQNPTNLYLSVAMSLFVFLSAWLWKNGAHFVRATVRMPFAKVFSLLNPEEVTFVRPPSGDPDANPHKYWLLLRTLYGLRRSPWHWCNKINAILQSIGLTPSIKDPCLYSGFIVDPSNPSSTQSDSPLSLGLYGNNFVYFSKDQAVKALFCQLLSQCCKVDFIGIVNWFLGIHFSWRITPTSVTVNLNQSGFATNLVESFSLQDRNQSPTETPYRSGVPIDLIAKSLEADDSLSLKCCKEAYQSFIGSIGWLAVAWLQQRLIYSVWDANFFEVSIISSLLVLFDVLRSQWLLSFILSSGVPFGCTDGGCLVCPYS